VSLAAAVSALPRVRGLDLLVGEMLMDLLLRVPHARLGHGLEPAGEEALALGRRCTAIDIGHGSTP
jgi:hypothetical protein